MRIAYSNETDTAASLLANSENANYPIENVTTNSLSKTYRSTGVASEWIRVAAATGSTITASCAVLAGHNATSAISVIVRAASTAAALSSAPTTSVGITYQSGPMVIFFTEMFKHLELFPKFL